MKSGLCSIYPKYPTKNSPNSDINTPASAGSPLKKQIRKPDVSAFPQTYDISEMEVNSNDKKRRKRERPKKERSETPLVHVGPWKSDEHWRVMEALSFYGNAWGKVRRYVGTRTRAQIWSHLQKHFLKQRENYLCDLCYSGKIANRVFIILKEYRNMQSLPKKISCNKQKISKEFISYSLEKTDSFSSIPLQSSSHYDNTPLKNILFDPFESIPLNGDVFQGEFERNENIKEFKELELETSQQLKDSSPFNLDAEYFLNPQYSLEDEEQGFL